MGLSRKLTKERFTRRNAAKAQGRIRGRRLFCEKPVGENAIDAMHGPLTLFLAGDRDIKPPARPAGLAPLIEHIPPATLAATILVPLLDRAHSARGWSTDRLAQVKQKRMVGEYLRDQVALNDAESAAVLAGDKSKQRFIKKIRRGRPPPWDFLKSEWTEIDCIAAGNWMIDCALTLNFFVIDDHGRVAVAPDWQRYIDKQLKQLLERHPVFAPHLQPPSDWTDWRKPIDDRLQANFVRNSRPENKTAIVRAFQLDREYRGVPQTAIAGALSKSMQSGRPFEHAHAVNRLQRVPLCVDQQMADLVERFAVELMDHQGQQRELDDQQVKADLRIARWIGDRPFYIGYNCDRRGRLNPLQNFNYHRQDHVRSLFRFARGRPLGRDDVDWLEIHVANTKGTTDKKPWRDRQQWVADNRNDIARVAADPVGTFDFWRDADKPFAFVAACREFVWALNNPKFETHLPIGFDGSNNALQHVALLCRDRKIGEKVNLIDTKSPQDIYAEIIAHVKVELKNDIGKWAAWCGETFERLGPKKVRKLLKTPAMTFAYGSTTSGKARQICDEFGDQLEWKAALYLAQKIDLACGELLPRPTRVLDYICDAARWCHGRKQFLKWTSPTGFPVFNSYYRSETQTINMLQNGGRVRNNVDVPTSARDAPKAINSASANFVQSLDASHLCRVVNRAAEEDMIDVVCVHDSFACLATQARRFNQIIRTQLSLLYARQDHLRSLSDAVSPPPYGDLDPLEVQNAEYCFA